MTTLSPDGVGLKDPIGLHSKRLTSSTSVESKRQSLGRLLLEARQSRTGTSLSKAARDIGISAAYLHKLERDEVRRPSVLVLQAIARTYNIEYSVLAGLSLGVPHSPSMHLATLPAPVQRLVNGIDIEEVRILQQILDRMRQRTSGV